MKKEYILGILFFSGIWGAFEVILGGFLYSRAIAHASAPLTVIGFAILTIACIYLPQKGQATFIGLIAMFYKFLNTPFFACHLLGIFLLGLSYDLVFNFSKIKSKAICAVLSTYLGYILFALSITYIFRYPHWLNAGLPKIIRYVGLSGSLAACLNLVIVPLVFNFAQRFRDSVSSPFIVKSRFATSSIVSLITLALWLLGMTRCF